MPRIHRVAPTLIGFGARLIAISYWRIYRIRACGPVSRQPSSKFVVYLDVFSSPLHGAVVIVRLSIEKPVTDDRLSV
jgi:hypothetical protein